GREVGYCDEVELSERIFDRVIPVVELEDRLRRIEGALDEVHLVRRGADANRDPVFGALRALEIADGDGDQVRRHLRRRRELQRVLRARRTWRIRQRPAVADGRIAAVERER